MRGDFMSIGMRLLAWRKEQGLKTTDLRDSTGISLGALSNYENDRREISSNFLLKLQEIYNADIYYILTGVRMERGILTQNEQEMLENFKVLPEREQIKLIGIVEEKAQAYKVKSEKSSASRTG